MLDMLKTGEYIILYASETNDSVRFVWSPFCTVITDENI